MTTDLARIQIRRGTAAQWAAANPVLLMGELGLETDTKVQKTGDGVTAWVSLPSSQSSTYAALSAASQTFLGQQVIKRPSAVTNTPLLNITDQTAAARFTFAVSAGAATQQQIYGQAKPLSPPLWV